MYPAADLDLLVASVDADDLEHEARLCKPGLERTARGLVELDRVPHQGELLVLAVPQ